MVTTSSLLNIITKSVSHNHLSILYIKEDAFYDVAIPRSLLSTCFQIACFILNVVIRLKSEDVVTTDVDSFVNHYVKRWDHYEDFRVTMFIP